MSENANYTQYVKYFEYYNFSYITLQIRSVICNLYGHLEFYCSDDG